MKITLEHLDGGVGDCIEELARAIDASRNDDRVIVAGLLLSVCLGDRLTSYDASNFLTREKARAITEKAAKELQGVIKGHDR